jgi:hypothetical protein
MKPERKNAIVAGLLFIIATSSALIGDAILGARLSAPDYLAAIFADNSRLILSVIFKFIAAATSAGIAISLYPVLRRRSESLALGSVCFRLIEGVFYLIAALGLLALVPISQEYAGAGPALAPGFQVAGTLIQAVAQWSGFALAVLAFCLGASMYYFVFFRTRLVPRWLSLWGLLALASLLAMVLIGMFSGMPKPSGGTLVLALPIAAQEIVLGLWLIAKGFDPAALGSRESS